MPNILNPLASVTYNPANKVSITSQSPGGAATVNGTPVPLPYQHNYPEHPPTVTVTIENIGNTVLEAKNLPYG